MDVLKESIVGGTVIAITIIWVRCLKEIVGIFFNELRAEIDELRGIVKELQGQHGTRLERHSAALELKPSKSHVQRVVDRRIRLAKSQPPESGAD